MTEPSATEIGLKAELIPSDGAQYTLENQYLHVIEARKALNATFAAITDAMGRVPDMQEREAVNAIAKSVALIASALRDWTR